MHIPLANKKLRNYAHLAANVCCLSLFGFEVENSSGMKSDVLHWHWQSASWTTKTATGERSGSVTVPESDSECKLASGENTVTSASKTHLDRERRLSDSMAAGIGS